MVKLLFNTGVKPWNNSKLSEYEEFVNGEKHVAFYVSDIPENGTFAFACPNFTAKKYENNPNYAIRKILAGGLISDCAVFKIYKI